MGAVAMRLDLFTWTPDKHTLMDGLAAYNFWPHPEVQISHLGPITKRWIEDGERKSRTTTGHHANLRCFGSLAQWFIEGKPQTDENGNPLSIFERTKTLDIIEGLEFVAIPSEGVPSGYRGPNGVVLIDPASVKTPYNRWA